MKTDNKPTATLTSHTNSSTISNRSRNPTTIPQSSRIPRVANANKTESAVVKRTQSSRSLISKAEAQVDQNQPAPHLLSSNMDVLSALHNTSTVDVSVQTEFDELDKSLRFFNRNSFVRDETSCDNGDPVQTSRASSSTTVKPSSSLHDPDFIDSAIIYSRKKSDAKGKKPISSTVLSLFTFAYAHGYKTGTSNIINVPMDRNSIVSP